MGSFAGVGSELARGRSSVEEVKSGREDLLHRRDRDRGTVAFSWEGREGAWEVRGPGARSGRLAVLVSPKGDGACVYRS